MCRSRLRRKLRVSWSLSLFLRLSPSLNSIQGPRRAETRQPTVMPTWRHAGCGGEDERVEAIILAVMTLKKRCKALMQCSSPVRTGSVGHRVLELAPQISVVRVLPGGGGDTCTTKNIKALAWLLVVWHRLPTIVCSVRARLITAEEPGTNIQFTELSVKDTDYTLVVGK